MIGQAPDEATAELEPLEEFRSRARRWLADHLDRLAPGEDPMPTDPDGIAEARRIQARLFDGGFAGLCFPRAYGGQGLPSSYQLAFTEEAAGYRMPLIFNMVTLSILAPTLLDHGSEAQCRRHIPAILRGEEIWAQLLSEPTNGSDLAGALTRARRDGDEWVLDGSKIWSTGAHRAEFAMCLARTNWDVPKHAGLTMFLMALRQPGVTVERITQSDGTVDFCQEFLDGVRLPADSVIGEVDGGWAVASRQLWHERNAVGGATPYMSGVMPSRGTGAPDRTLVELALDVGRAGEPVVRQQVAEAYAEALVHPMLVERITTGLRLGVVPEASGAILKLYGATAAIARAEVGVAVAGAAAAGAPPGSRSAAAAATFIGRQARGLGGGSNEMQRNIISERVLDMPREPSPDRGRPFGEVRHNVAPRGPAT